VTLAPVFEDSQLTGGPSSPVKVTRHRAVTLSDDLTEVVGSSLVEVTIECGGAKVAIPGDHVPALAALLGGC